MKGNKVALQRAVTAASIASALLWSTTTAWCSEVSSLWTRDNVVAWEVAPYDSARRDPEERARMLRDQGVKYYAYLSTTDPHGTSIPINNSHFDADAEIRAMQKHGIEVVAWYLWINTDEPAEDPNVRATLERFRRWQIHPTLWVSESFAHTPKDENEWRKWLPADVPMPRGMEDMQSRSAEQKAAIASAYERIGLENFPKTPAEHADRVIREAARIAKLAKLAENVGCTVQLYNHRGWFGVMDNQLAILALLKQSGVTNVGIVYNFGHSRDKLHDDSKSFATLWPRIQPYVTAVNVTALPVGRYLSQGDGELAMMRVIEKSGWRGRIGVLVPPGDAALELQRQLEGLRWVAAELRLPGSQRQRPNLPTEPWWPR
jgi:hypothetical protein